MPPQRPSAICWNPRARKFTHWMLDAYISNLIKTTIDKGYLFSSKHMQTLYRLVYQLAENNGASYFNSAPSIINIINALGASKFAKVIANHVPDVIICTHVFAGTDGR